MLYFIYHLIVYFTLSNARQFYSSLGPGLMEERANNINIPTKTMHGSTFQKELNVYLHVHAQLLKGGITKIQEINIACSLLLFLFCSVGSICLAKFDRDQKTALMIPAKEAYGDVILWDENVLGGLCNLLEALPVRDILNLAADVVSKSP